MLRFAQAFGLQMSQAKCARWGTHGRDRRALRAAQGPEVVTTFRDNGIDQQVDRLRAGGLASPRARLLASGYARRLRVLITAGYPAAL